MVTTVRPKASATPTRPMPVAPSEAARTAAPVPPKTSQNVPKNSVAAGLPVLMFDPPRISELRFRGRWYPPSRPPKSQDTAMEPRGEASRRSARGGKQEGRPNGRPGRLGSGGRIRTCDLRVISPKIGRTLRYREFVATRGFPL